MKNQEKKQPNPYLQFTGLGIQMLLVVFAGNYLGGLLDVKYGSQDAWFSKGMTVLSVFISIILVIKQTQQIQNK